MSETGTTTTSSFMSMTAILLFDGDGIYGLGPQVVVRLPVGGPPVAPASMAGSTWLSVS
jgi:hypothetical protein